MAKAPLSKAARPVSKCSWCGATFKKLEHAQRHERTHTLDRPYECKAPDCGKKFARQDTLTRHFRLHTRDLQSSTKSSRTSPIMPSARRRTLSASEALPARRAKLAAFDAHERRATESYLPSPSSTDVQTEVSDSDAGPVCEFTGTPHFEASLADAEVGFETLHSVRPMTSLSTSAPYNALELYQVYATPESIAASPLPQITSAPSFTADSAAAAAFDLTDCEWSSSTTSEETRSLDSIDDEVKLASSAGEHYDSLFASLQTPVLPFQQHIPYVPFNALRMNMGEQNIYATIGNSDFPKHHYGSGIYGPPSSYLAP